MKNIFNALKRAFHESISPLVYFRAKYTIKRIMHQPINDGQSDKAINVLTAADENFIIPLATLIKSIEYNSKKHKSIDIYILDGGIRNESKQKLLSSIESDCISIKFLEISPAFFKKFKISGHINGITYARLLADKILPESMKKIIYLDSDTIVLKDIGLLWDIPLGNNYLLAVQEQCRHSNYLSSERGLISYKILGLDPKNKFFNAGVLVINLEKWKEEKVAKKVEDYLIKYREYVLWHDQDGLNAVCSDKWGELEKKWNVCAQSFMTENLLKYPEYKKFIYNPNIIHFNTANKPWQENNKHPYRDLWYYYLNKTTWKGWRP
jgi:lipopolysaccharide biosynthesis glycosyltransferase